MSGQLAVEEGRLKMVSEKGRRDDGGEGNRRETEPRDREALAWTSGRSSLSQHVTPLRPAAS